VIVYNIAKPAVKYHPKFTVFLAADTLNKVGPGLIIAPKKTWSIDMPKVKVLIFRRQPRDKISPNQMVEAKL
jgi:hypothetical protein